MRTHRFRLILLAALVAFAALGATRSRRTVPAPRRHQKSSDAPPGPGLQRSLAGGSAAHPSSLRRTQTSGGLTAHRFGLIPLVALVLFVASSAGAEPIHSVPPAVGKKRPALAALPSPPEVLSKPARDSGRLERVETKRPLHSVKPFVVKPSQKLATLLAAHEVFAKPARDSARLGLVRARRPLTGTQTVLPVVGARIGARGIGWLHVGLPGRPNGRTGWIRQRATVASTTRWHILVDISRRRVTVYRNSRPMRIVQAVVGKPSTPTPLGTFFVEEAIQLRATDVGAPYALALSARSNVLQEFDGGPGQTALHGLANVGGVLGSAVSHGCVRLDNDTMRWLVLRIGSGVPVTVRR